MRNEKLHAALTYAEKLAQEESKGKEIDRRLNEKGQLGTNG